MDAEPDAGGLAAPEASFLSAAPHARAMLFSFARALAIEVIQFQVPVRLFFPFRAPPREVP